MGSSVTITQSPFFDIYNSHWDNDALDNLAENHYGSFFLIAGNSTVDQPDNNALNTVFKAYFNEITHFYFDVVEACKQF